MSSLTLSEKTELVTEYIKKRIREGDEHLLDDCVGWKVGEMTTHVLELYVQEAQAAK